MGAEQPSAVQMAAQIAQQWGLTLHASLGGRANGSHDQLAQSIVPLL
jgi:hypothetical protein